MIRFLSAIPLFLVSFLAYAIEDVSTAPAQLPPSSLMPIIIFGILFFGMIGGFFYYMWKNEQKRKDQEGKSK
jgi:hypothetical protein